MNDKIKVMQTPKRMCLKGHMVTVYLTDYDASNDSYYGFSVRSRSMNTGENPPIQNQVIGARPYPYADRPNYAFQFVEMGENEQVLLDIAQGNVTDPAGTRDTPTDPNAPENGTEGDGGAPQGDPRDTDGDGTVSKAEKQAWKKQKGEK